MALAQEDPLQGALGLPPLPPLDKMRIRSWRMVQDVWARPTGGSGGDLRSNVGDGGEGGLGDGGVAAQQVLELDDGLCRHKVAPRLQEAQQALHDASHVLHLPGSCTAQQAGPASFMPIQHHLQAVVQLTAQTCCP